MKKDNEIYKSADKIAENEKVVKGSEKDVVKGSENADTNLANALDLEEIKLSNVRIGRRIAEIMTKSGMNAEQFYTLLYPNSKEAPATKRNRMSDILNAAAFDGKSGAKLLDFPRLLFISQYFNVPLNYLLYGEAEPTAETPPVLQAEKATTEKAETENDTPLTVRSICQFLVAILPLFELTLKTDVEPIDSSNDNDLKFNEVLWIGLSADRPNLVSTALNLLIGAPKIHNNKTKYTFIRFNHFAAYDILGFIRDYIEIQKDSINEEERKAKIKALISYLDNDPLIPDNDPHILCDKKAHPISPLLLFELFKSWSHGNFKNNLLVYITLPGMKDLGSYVFSVTRHGFRLNDIKPDSYDY